MLSSRECGFITFPLSLIVTKKHITVEQWETRIWTEDFIVALVKKILTCSNSYESWLVQNPDWNLWICHAYPLFKYALLCMGYPPSSFVLSQHTLHLTDTHQLFLLSCLFVTWTAVYFCERTLPSNEYGGVKDDESHDNFPCSNHSLYPASFCSI